MILNRTIIIAAVYCCGKTYSAEHNDRYSMIDIESAIKKEKIDSMHEYADKIMEYIGKYDIIFTPVFPVVLYKLKKSNIPYYLVYPDKTKECYLEWEKRNIVRNTVTLWNKIKYYHNMLLNDLKKNKTAKKHFVLNKDQYINDILDDIVKYDETIY